MGGETYEGIALWVLSLVRTLGSSDVKGAPGTILGEKTLTLAIDAAENSVKVSFGSFDFEVPACVHSL